MSSKTPSSDVPGQVQIIDPTARRLVPMAIEEPTEDLAHLTEVIRQIKTTLEDGNVWADNITQLAFSGSIPNSAGDLSVLSTQVLNNAVTAAQLAQSLAEVAKALAETASASAQSSSGLAATDATNAGVSATAAQQSNVAAGASATNAAQSAAAAQTDALTAQTKAGEASVSAAAAVVSDNAASNAASAATSARDVAVKTYGRGQHPNPVFLDWQGATPLGWAFSAAPGTISKSLTGNFGNAVLLTTNNPSTSVAPTLSVGTGDASVPFSADPHKVQVDLDIELMAGSWVGASIQVEWLNALSVVLETIVYELDPYLAGNTGVLSPRFYFERATTTAATTYRVTLTCGVTGKLVYKQLKVHGFQVREVVGEALSSITQAAVTNIQGDMAASASFRVQAGNAVSLLDLFVSNNQGQAVSVAKLSAASIILDGSVTANHMNVSSLSAITATIGTMRTATTGERMELHDNLLVVYDAANVVRVKLGNLV